eukprot:m.281047 g.281047  ORF g.281047 m.281047 type:complete len:128 (-) comp19401_c3_seq16:419-802(-)
MHDVELHEIGATFHRQTKANPARLLLMAVVVWCGVHQCVCACSSCVRVSVCALSVCARCLCVPVPVLCACLCVCVCPCSVTGAMTSDGVCAVPQDMLVEENAHCVTSSFNPKQRSGLHHSRVPSQWQ